MGEAVKRQNGIYGMEDSPRGRLLSEAAKLFRDKGYERTTVRDIAAAVVIQSGSIFHHFPSKEAFLFAVIEEVIRTNTDRQRQTMLGEPIAEGRRRSHIHQEWVFIIRYTSEA